VVTLLETVLAFGLARDSGWRAAVAGAEPLRRDHDPTSRRSKHAGGNSGAIFRSVRSGHRSKVALGVTLVFFIVFFNVYQGVKESARWCWPTRGCWRHAAAIAASRVLPSATSWVFSSLHTSVGLAFVGAVVGEYLGSSRGVGY